MSLFGLFLVLLAAICHATWNFFVKRINAGPELVWLFSIIAAVLYLPLAVWIYLSEAPSFGAVDYLFIVGSALLHLAYFLLLQTGYRHGDLSLVYPTARATGPVISTGLAVLILGETVSPQIVVGAAIVIFGVLNLTGGFRRGGGSMGVSLAFGLGAGLLIGGYTAWDAYTVSLLAVPPLLLDYASSIARSTVLAPIAWRRRARVAQIWRDHRAGVLVIAVCNPLAYILVLYALTFTPVVYVAPLRETSVLLTVLAGSLFLGEGNLKTRLTWSAVILAGVSILATG
ncbi:EamA family transporter [Pacificispira sp.]|uniref:EamA family transporter n=1 Tax=Pacificispira sp. TaxID=2888761 RepID=UPI003B515B24